MKILCACLLFALAGASEPALAQRQRAVEPVSAPDHHLPGMDGAPAYAKSIGGELWAAWSYRNGDEFDLAVSVLREGVWSEPSYFGAGDGDDQVEAAIVADSSGNLFVGWVVSSENADQGSVMVATRRAGSNRWSSPALIASGDSVASPALEIAGQQVVVAFRNKSGIDLVILNKTGLFGTDNGIIVDGPDPITRKKDK